MQSENAVQQLTDEARWSAIQRKVQERNVSRAFSLFRARGIEPVLIKGIAAAAYYPETAYRPSIDMDLAVAGSDFAAATELADSAAAEGLAIDLHHELRHLDTVPWEELVAHSRLVESVDGGYRVLRAEDHLRVLCVHWLNDGGVSKPRLWDIFYLIENRAADFDWDRALGIVSPQRRRWIVCTIGLANKYLHLNLTGTPIENEAANLPGWLIKTVEREWASGQELIPLWLILNSPKKLLGQISLRLNPNPIRATVEMEGSFDARTRIFYKIGNFFQRLFPSLKRNFDTIQGSDRRNKRLGHKRHKKHKTSGSESSI